MPSIYIVLRPALARATRTILPLVLAFMAIVMFAGAAIVYLLEHDVNPDFRTIGDCFWWMIVTMATTGYGDKVPVTGGGRTVAAISMITGPVLLATLVTSFGAMFYDEWQRGARGMVKITSKGHILICGWNTTAADVIAELRQSEIFASLPITVIDDAIDFNPADDSKTSFVRGAPSEVKILEQANVSEAKYVIAIARDKTPTADQQTVLTVLAIRNLNPRVYICAELNDVHNEGHLKRAGCNTIVNTGSLTSGLLALSLQNPVINEVIRDLASFHGADIYRVEAMEVKGQKFGDILVNYKKEYDAVIIGIEREGKTLLNPAGSLELKESDYLLVVADEPPLNRRKN